MNKLSQSHNRSPHNRRRAVSGALLGVVLASGCGYEQGSNGTKPEGAMPSAPRYSPEPTVTVTETATPTETQTTEIQPNTPPPSASKSPEATKSPLSQQAEYRHIVANLLASCNLDGFTSYATQKDGKKVRAVTLDVSFEANQDAKAARENHNQHDDITFTDTKLAVMNLNQKLEPEPYMGDKTFGTHYPRNAKVEIPDKPAEGTTYVVVAYDTATTPSENMQTKVLTPCGSLKYENDLWVEEGNGALPDGIEPKYQWDYKLN